MSISLLQLERSCFEESSAARLGGHVAAVVREIERIAPGATWYVADVFYVTSPPSSRELVDVEEPQLIGGSQRLIEICERVDQFESGRFWACRVGTSLDVHRYKVKGRLCTESTELELGGAAFELRAFDTSYIELYADDQSALIALQGRLGGSIVTR